MAVHAPKSDSSSPNAGAASSPLQGVARVMSGLRTWATGHWLRSLIIASTILTVIGVTIGGWAYLASVAIEAGEPTVEGALDAYDKGQYEEARSMVNRLLTNGRLSHGDYGGPLMVLGGVKIHDAQQQAISERRRAEYMIASRYLTEARAYGLPEEREVQGGYLLGQSLIESGQFDEGVRILSEVAADPAMANRPRRDEVLYLLAETCLLMPHPKISEALRYNGELIPSKNLSDDQRAMALVQRAECLTRLERYEEARKTLATIPRQFAEAPAVSLMTGRILLDEVEAALKKLPPDEQAAAAKAQKEAITTAINNVMKAAPSNELKDRSAAVSSYQVARGLALRGDVDEALARFAQTRQFFPDTYEGLAASLGEANLLRQKGEFGEALAAYRRVLEGFAEIPVYRNRVLSVERIREEIVVAQSDLLTRERFDDVLALLDHFPPLFTRAEQLELRGTALERWGNALLNQRGDDSSTSDTKRAEGMQRMRAAGVAFEQLAELRFATKYYTADLWRAAEDFFQGGCFSRSVKALRVYLQYEPELRNAQALLRLGQAQLALGKVPESVQAFEECIEFHPVDPSTYQARLDCAKAQWYLGNTDRAEELLRDNIVGSDLKPASPEWKDSLFELGMLLHEKGEYEDAILRLEEAVERYSDDPQWLSAKYVIGECYRRWAQESLLESKQTRGGSEHDKAVQNATDRLNASLRQFEEVQRTITLKTHDIHREPLLGAMLRNCYMLEGAVLFDLGTLTNAAERYKEAIEAYSNVSSLYPNEPFVLETFVQIANCWRRLNRHDNARGAVQQAQLALDRLPAESDFASTTVLNREEWRLLLANMSKW